MIEVSRVENGSIATDNEADVHFMNLKDMPTQRLVDIAADRKKRLSETKEELDIVNAEIQLRAVGFQEDRHIKFTEWFGSRTGTLASVTVSQSMEILNLTMLRGLLGAELVDQKIRIKSQDIKYDIDKSFQRALTAIVMDDYSSDMTMEEIVDKAGWLREDPRKRAALLKKLSGDYEKDLKAVCSCLNIYPEEANIDEELYMIYQAKNWQLIRAFFDDNRFHELAEAVKRCVAVDETPRITVKCG